MLDQWYMDRVFLLLAKAQGKFVAMALDIVYMCDRSPRTCPLRRWRAGAERGRQRRYARRHTDPEYILGQLTAIRPKLVGFGCARAWRVCAAPSGPQSQSPPVRARRSESQWDAQSKFVSICQRVFRTASNVLIREWTQWISVRAAKTINPAKMFDEWPACLVDS